jgi:hypothetical protein
MSVAQIMVVVRVFPVSVEMSSDHNCRSLVRRLYGNRNECAIYNSTHDENAVFWAKENLHFTMELEHNPPHVMLWARMNVTHFIGPYFFQWT